MADMAELGLVAYSEGVVSATEDLKAFREEAREVDNTAGEMVDAIQEIDDALEKVETATKLAAEEFERTSSEVSDFANELDAAEQAAEDTADAIDDAASATDELADSLAGASGKFKDVIDDLKHEYDLIGKTAKEKRVMNELRKAGVPAASAEGEAIKKAVDAIERENKALERAEAIKKRVRVATMALAAAITTGLVVGIGDSVNRLENERVLLNRYTQALATMGSETAYTADKFKKMADDIEMATGRLSTEILELGANAASFGFDDTVFERAIRLANDMAAAWGGDLRMNFEGLARALDDPIKGFAMLRMRGISLTETQADMVKKLVDTNRELEAQSYIMKILEQQVGGVAAAGFDGLTAAWHRLTKASQLFFDGIVQGTGLMTGLQIVLNAVTAAITWMTDNMAASVPIITATGIALAAVFGPSIVAGIQLVATWIGTQLVRSVLAFNAALLANPLAIFTAAVIGVMAYLIDWQDTIAGLIQIWGAFTYAWYKFWGDEEGMKRSVEIVLNAEKAAADLLKAGEELKNKINLAGLKMGGDIEGAGGKAGNSMKNGIEQGAKSAAQMLQDSAQAAVAQYEEMNGKLSEIIVKSHKTGAEYIYNAYTGAVKQATTTATQTIKQGVESGGETAGESMKSSIVAGGQAAGATIYNSVESAFASLAHLSEVFAAFYRRERMELKKIQAETAKEFADAEKALAEAELARKQASRGDFGGSGGSGGGSGRSGGGGTTGGNFDGWNDPFFKPTDDNSQPGQKTTTTTTEIKNVVDPNMMVDVMDTAQGHNAIINVIKYNREELRALLGST